MIVDVNRVAELGKRENGRVGATVRQRDSAGNRLVDLAMPYVGHYVTRNRGTVGGSLAHADGRGAGRRLVVLGGEASTSKGRRLLAEELFISQYTTALAADELLVDSTWPEGDSVGFEEVALRAETLRSRCACSCAWRTARFARRGWESGPRRAALLLELRLEGAPATPETARAPATALQRLSIRRATCTHRLRISGT